MRPLTPDEEQVIAHGATEPPFSGRYWNHKADGTYACRRCGAALYRSDQRRALRAGAAVARLRRQRQAHARGQMDGLQLRGRKQTHFPAPRRRALAAGKAALCAIQTHRVSLLAPLWYHAAAPLSMRMSFAEKQLSAPHV